jgi:hypothetical protein
MTPPTGVLEGVQSMIVCAPLTLIVEGFAPVFDVDPPGSDVIVPDPATCARAGPP